MSKDVRTEPAAREHSADHGTATSEDSDFISLRDILVMILRHRWSVAIFVVLVTLAAGIFFICQPRAYEAEGYIQVIAPVSIEGRVDQTLYETMIASHLHRLPSAFIAKNVATVLKAEGIETTALDLSRRMKITRPPKTDLIRLQIADKSPDSALAIIRHWIELYQESIQNNNVRTTLSQVRLLLKIAQSDTMEKQAAVDQLKARALQTASLITVSRAVDDRQLWNDLSQKAAPDAEYLKKLADVHIKGQEPSAEYINLKHMLVNAEQLLSVVQARRNFYRNVERLLEERSDINTNKQLKPAKPSVDDSKEDEAELYVQTILKSMEIVQFGEPGLIFSGRGVLKKTALVFVGALVLACLVAYFEEWGRGLLSS